MGVLSEEKGAGIEPSHRLGAAPFAQVNTTATFEREPAVDTQVHHGFTTDSEVAAMYFMHASYKSLSKYSFSRPAADSREEKDGQSRNCQSAASQRCPWIWSEG